MIRIITRSAVCHVLCAQKAIRAFHGARASRLVWSCVDPPLFEKKCLLLHQGVTLRELKALRLCAATSRRGAFARW